MNIEPAHANWIAVVASSIAFSVLGGIWFGAVVPKLYAKALGRPDLLGQKPSATAIAGPFFCGGAMTIANALFMPVAGVEKLGQAAFFGLAVSLGYLAPMIVNIAINPNFPRPFLYSLINSPYFIGANIISCLIIQAMS